MASEILSSATNKGYSVTGLDIFIDLSKAFDTFSHEKLLIFAFNFTQRSLVLLNNLMHIIAY